MFKLRLCLWCGVLLFCFVSLAGADEVRYLRSASTGRVITIIASQSLASGERLDAVGSAEAFLAEHGKAFGLKDPKRELFLKSQETDSLGMIHLRYGQEHLGVPVYGGEVIVHEGPDYTVKSVNGAIVSGIKVSSRPKLKEKEAIKAAEKIWLGKYPEFTPRVKRTGLWVLEPSLFNNTNDPAAYLVWEVELLNRRAWKGESFFIDAHDGKLILWLNHVREIDARAYDCSSKPGTDMCSSNFYTTYNGSFGWGFFPPTEYIFGCRSVGYTQPCPHGPNPRYLPGEESFDTDNVFALMSHTYPLSIHNYYQTKFGRNGANGQGGNTDGTFEPIDRDAAATYIDWLSGWPDGCKDAIHWHEAGDGYCKGVVVPDVVGHEYSHGLNFTDPLTYQGQSGALDENHSDVMGEMFEYWNTGANDWLIAAGALGGPWRNLQDPPSMTSPLTGDPYPDRFHSVYFYCGSLDYYGVHINSTVPSKGHYLASEGGYFNGCTVSAVGKDVVEQILHRARTVYYTQGESFNAAYNHQIQACNDLYGAGSFECKEFTQALQAVEMNQPGKCSGQQPQPPACQCEDSDEGNNPNIYGVVTYLGQQYGDYCVDQTHVAEQYCSANVQQQQVHTCTGGRQCQGGVCKFKALNVAPYALSAVKVPPPVPEP